MTTLAFFIRRDLKDNLPLWIAPLVLFTLVFALSLLWRNQAISSQFLKISLQICTFLFIFVSATLYGKYLNSVIGTSLQVRTQMSLTRNYLFSLPLSRSHLFWMNQVRLILPLIPFILLTTIFIVTFNPVHSKITVGGLVLASFCLSWLLLNYFIWICYMVEKSFEYRSLAQAIRGFFVVNPLLLLVAYFLFLRKIPFLSQGLSWSYLPALLVPAIFLGLNYMNWLKRD